MAGKQHWWWDTKRENDGGSLNDDIMRDFYSSCLAASNGRDQEYKQLSSGDEDAGSKEVSEGRQMQSNSGTRQGTEKGSDTSDGGSGTSPSSPSASTAADGVTIQDTSASTSASGSGWKDPCVLSNYTLSAASVSSQGSLCGVRVLQQFRSNVMSSVRVQCSIGAPAVERERELVTMQRKYDQQYRMNMREKSFDDTNTDGSTDYSERKDEGTCGRIGQFRSAEMASSDILEHLWMPSHDSWDSIGRSSSSRDTSEVMIDNDFSDSTYNAYNEQDGTSRINMKDMKEDSVGIAVLCEVTTQNVKRLRVTHGVHRSLIPLYLLEEDPQGTPPPPTHPQGQRYVIHLLVDNTPVRLPYFNPNSFNNSGNYDDNGGRYDDIDHSHKKSHKHQSTEICIGRKTSVLSSSALYFPPPTHSSHYPCLSVCTSAMSPLREKVPLTAGPVRSLYSRPFYIVYGTPQHDHDLRVRLRDLAVYIGNAHTAAYNTHVRVLADLEYRSGGYLNQNENGLFHNVMLVGGPDSNKASMLLLNSRSGSGIGNREGGNGEKGKRERGRDSADSKKGGAQVLGNTSVSFHLPADKWDRGSFRVGNNLFDSVDDAIIFTFPIVRSRAVKEGGIGEKEKDEAGDEEVAMGVMLSANSAEGYLHLSRLSWPVVPPMVRSPFSTLLPDYTVIDSRVWGKGFGGTLLAGFWGPNWEYAEADAFVDL